MGFSIYTGKGFRMTFANGYTLSVVFDYGTYSANRYTEGEHLRNHGHFRYLQKHESPDAEIAIFDPDDNFVNLGSDDVEGWVSPDAVARVAAFVTTLAPGTTKVDLNDLLKG